MNAAGSPDLIFVSLEPWDDIWRRNQFVCDELSRRDPNRRILFVGPPVDVSSAIRRCTTRELGSWQTRSIDGRPNLVVTRPCKWTPDSLGPTRLLNQAITCRHIWRNAERLGMYRDGRQPLLWINPPYGDYLVRRLPSAGVIYDITDDWTQFGEDTSARRRLIQQDRRLSDAADAIIVCSESLAESKQRYADKVHLVKNGVDCRHYASVCSSDGMLPTEAQAWAKPVLGYTGTVHRDRLDVGLVEAMAKQMDAGSVVLIGPIHLNGDEISRLESTGRVVVAGPVPYASLPGYMRAFDACIVPHRVTPFTESLNPIKLWEYLACGKPIVSTPVAGFRDFPEMVHLADGPEAFLSSVDTALTENGVHASRRRHAAEVHSWSSRVDVIEDVLERVAVEAFGTESDR